MAIVAKLYTHLSFDPEILFPRIYSKVIHANMKRCMHKAIHCRNVCYGKRLETTKMSSLGNRWTKLWEIHTMECDTDVKKGTRNIYSLLWSDFQDIT